MRYLQSENLAIIGADFRSACFGGDHDRVKFPGVSAIGAKQADQTAKVLLVASAAILLKH